MKCDTVPSQGGGGAIIVNEFSNGPAGTQEFIELLVIGGGECIPVDVRGFIIDDNNGDFSAGSLTGSGIAKGHIRFKHLNNWQAIPAWSMIVIYNADEINSALPLGDDPSDMDGDGVYILPSNSDLIEGTTTIPSADDPYDYGMTESYETGDWKSVVALNTGDAMQVRYPDGSYCHGISYGNPSIITGGPDDLLISPYSGTGKVLYFTKGSPTYYENFVRGDVSDGDETPGQPNNGDNQEFINGICEGSIAFRSVHIWRSCDLSPKK